MIGAMKVRMRSARLIAVLAMTQDLIQLGQRVGRDPRRLRSRLS